VTDPPWEYVLDATFEDLDDALRLRPGTLRELPPPRVTLKLRYAGREVFVLRTHPEPGEFLVTQSTVAGHHPLDALVAAANRDALADAELNAETDAERDARFAFYNDATWGAGNWVRCPTCPPDSRGREPYHHKDAHVETTT